MDTQEESSRSNIPGSEPGSFAPTDQGPEAEGAGPPWEVQTSSPAPGPCLSRRHAPSPTGLQAQGVHGSAGQPQVCEERRHRKGEGPALLDPPTWPLPATSHTAFGSSLRHSSQCVNQDIIEPPQEASVRREKTGCS